MAKFANPLRHVFRHRRWHAVIGKLFTNWRSRDRRHLLRVRIGLPFESLEDRLAPAVFTVSTVTGLSTALQITATNDDLSNIIHLAPKSYSVVNQTILVSANKTLAIVGEGTGATLHANGQDKLPADPHVQLILKLQCEPAQ